MHFNRTDFYSINENAIKSMTESGINQIISKRKKKEKKTDDQKAQEAREKLERKYMRLAKKCGQNYYYIDNMQLEKCTDEKITFMVDLFEKAMEEFRPGKFNQKTLRGYVNNLLK